MPSPVGHALGGAIVALGLFPKPTQRDLAICAVAACLPDIDFLWGRHAMETHSVGASVLAGLAALAITRRPRLAIACGLAWASHIFFDWLGSDMTPPIGVMALWPFTSEYSFAGAYLFEAITRRYWLPNFWPQNIRAVIQEIGLLAPFVLVLGWWRFRSPTISRR